MNELAGKPLRYVIGSDNPGPGRLGEIIEVSYDIETPPPVGLSIAYCNCLDEKHSGRFPPYREQTDTAKKYNEGVPDASGPGFEANLVEQFQRRKLQDFHYIELDNPDAYAVSDVIRATDLARVYGLGVIAKNPLAMDENATRWIAHPNVFGVIVEKDAGTPDQMQVMRTAAGKPELPVWHVFFGDGLAQARSAAIRAGKFVNMGVTFDRAAEEYGGEIEDFQLPQAQQEPMANQDIIARARSYIGRFHDGPDVPALAREVAAKFPDLASYCALASSTTSWCGIFLAKVLSEFGIRPPHRDNDTGGFMWVDSWLQWGQTIPVGQEQPGDIAIFLGNPHHITLVAGNGRYIGGNQSDGVTEATYRTPDAIRRAPSAESILISPSRRRFTSIVATEFGGSADPNNSAYDAHFITDQEFGVALPARVPSPRPKVRVWKGGRSVDCDIVDVGPWNITDPYWETGSRPQAESGTDKSGRTTNLAGIDLTPAAARAIGLNGKGVVDWEFITETQMPEPQIIPPAKPDDLLKNIWTQLRPQLEPIIQQALANVVQEVVQQILAKQGLPALPPPTPPPPPVIAPSATPVSQRPSVQIGVLGTVLSGVLQAFGIIGTPLGMGAEPTTIGTAATVIPAAIAMTGLTGVWGTVANVGLNLVAGLLKNRLQKPQ